MPMAEINLQVHKNVSLIWLLAFICLVGSQNNMAILSHVTLSTGSEASQSPCSIQNQAYGAVVDCQSRNLGSVDLSWFPQNTTTILFGNNSLTSVPLIFDNLVYLRRLDLSHNKIENLNFSGLEKLEYLNLNYNLLIIHDFSKETFAPLKSLSALSLEQNGYFNLSSYPNDIFSRLLKLDTLIIGCFGGELYFGEESKNLTSFSTLIISGRLNRITNSSFENINQIKYLEINDITSQLLIDESPFVGLKYLSSLIFSNVGVQLKCVLFRLKDLVNKTMDTITLDTIRLVHGDSYNTLLTGDAILTPESTKYLKQICVAHVSIQRCFIFVIMDGALSSPVWDRCLKSINLNRNQIYGTKMFLFQLLNMKHLENIMIEFYNKFEPKTKSLMEIENIDQCRNGIGTKTKNSYSVGSETISLRATKFVEKAIIVYVSSSLRYLDFPRQFSSLSFDFEFAFAGANNLCFLDISESSGKVYTSTVRGLENLKILILAGNSINVLSYSFFDTMPGLETLDLSRNLIPNDLMSNFGDRLFQKLTNLHQLELSFNSLHSLSSSTFLYNRNLSELFLAGNRFRDIPFNLKYTPNLRVLDLRFNDLITLTADVRYSIDQLARDNNGFNLYLEGNVLSCGCNDIKFLLWMKLTIVNMDMDRNYSCIDTDGISRYTETITDVEAYWRQCTGETFLWFSIIMFCLIFIGFLLCFFVTKYKTYIISGLLNLFSETFQKKPFNYEIGVFIGYADRDYQFACHDLRQFIEDTLGLTTFIRERDISPSTSLASATVQAIDRSWRVLLVVNEKFLSCDRWFLFMCRAATSALTSANPKRIVVLVEDQLRHRLPAELSRVVLEDNIVVTRGNFLDYELKEKLKTRLLE